MKTAIRLQNHGKRNHKYWWIVVMGYYRSRKGRFVEHVGYWIPRKTKTVQRSVVLNKPRLRYWLAMGAQPSRKVSGFLSWADMWPSPVLKYGYNTLYRKKVLDPTKPEFYEVTKGTNFHGATQAKFYERRREIEEENLFLRKMQIQEELEKQIPKTELREIDKETTIHERTKKFYELRDQLYEHERDIKKLPSAKRDELYRELNERASKGITAENVSPKLLDLDQNEEAILNEKRFGNKKTTLEGQLMDYKMKEMHMNKNIAKNQMLYMKYLDQTKAAVKTLEETLFSLKPATKEDVVAILNKTHPEATPKEIQEKTNAFWNYMKEAALIPSKSDIKDWTVNEPVINSVKDIYKEEYLKDSKVYIPTANPVNPFPDITKYDPIDYHEVSLDPEIKINHNKAYNLPGVDDLKLQNKRQIRGNHRMNPVKARRRTGFCTLQKEFAAMNCSFYSFVLRKIEALQEEEQRK